VYTLDDEMLIAVESSD